MRKVVVSLATAISLALIAGSVWSVGAGAVHPSVVEQTEPGLRRAGPDGLGAGNPIVLVKKNDPKRKRAERCESQLQDCYVDCSLRWENGPKAGKGLSADMADGCRDSCRVGYNQCMS